VFQETDGYLIRRGGQSDATWLPEGWWITTYPIGWTLAHLQKWFDFAFKTIERHEWLERNPPDPAEEDYHVVYPEARDLVFHAHLIVQYLVDQHPEVRDPPEEPTSPMDLAGCRAELRRVHHFIRRALSNTPAPPVNQQTAGRSTAPQPTEIKTKGAAEDRPATPQGAGQPVPPAVGAKRLKPCEASAYLSYSHALTKQPDLEGSRFMDVYLWLREHGGPQYEGDHEIPDFESWSRYLRTALRARGVPRRHQPRALGKSGRRVVRKVRRSDSD
jgi:hypothetical protein